MVAQSTSLSPSESLGSYRYSDWTLLNHADTAQVLLLISIQPQISVQESQLYCDLLAIYHRIYRPALLQLRAEGYRDSCPPPTTAQLQQIADLLFTPPLTGEQVSSLLQALAIKLRESWLYL